MNKEQGCGAIFFGVLIVLWTLAAAGVFRELGGW